MAQAMNTDQAPTDTQARFWYRNQLEPTSTKHVCAAVFALSGSLDYRALSASFAAGVRAEPTLNSCFRVQGVSLVRELRPSRSPSAELVVLDRVASGRPADAMENLLRMSSRPFDLTTGPLIRASIVEIAADEHLLLIAMHRIVGGHSVLSRVLDGLGSDYGASATDRQRASSTPRTGRRSNSMLDINLTPGDEDHRFAHRSRSLEPRTTQALARAAAALGTSARAVLMSAMAATLYAYEGRAIQTFASPGLNVASDSLDSLLTVDYDCTGTFRELIATIEESFEREGPVQQSKSKTVGISHLSGPRCDAAASLEPLAALALRGAKAKLCAVRGGIANADADIGVSLIESGADSIIESRIVTRFPHFIDDLVHVIEVLPERLDRRLVELMLASSASWSSGRPSPVHQAEPLDVRCIRQAMKHPDSIAVSTAEESITYGELIDQAVAVSELLRGNGVRRGDLVGVSLGRSSRFISAVLGVLMTGGAYLPLDPTYPPARLAYMLSDSGARVVLAELDSEIGASAEVVQLSPDDAIVRPGMAPPSRTHSADDAAYLIYTSGTSGKPKGVLVGHAAACNLVDAQIEAFGLEQGMVTIQAASIGFDASISEIFTALCSGGVLDLREVGLLLSGSAPTAPGRSPVAEPTCVTLVPSVLARIDPAAVPHWHTVVSAGEQCTETVVKRWNKLPRMLNAYGPAETTVCATMQPDPQASVPHDVGSPIMGVSVLIADDEMRPRPVGAFGEVVVGGAGVSFGYLNNAALTASKFVPDPTGPPGSRMYRTGDAGLLTADGTVQLRGRIDAQINLHGHRIEPGEIEGVIGRHLHVDHAVAVESGGAIVAFCTTTDGRMIDASDLESLCVENLPRHSRPARFVQLDELPFAPGGKVDRAALSASAGELASSFDQTRARSEASQELRDPDEQTVAAVWSRVLGESSLDPSANFFELGGTSIDFFEAHIELCAHTELAIPFGEALSRPDVSIRTVAAMFRDAAASLEAS